MIRALRLRNLAVIEDLELELDPGLNVITGETGAGKSLLLEAMALLRGQRASSEVVRSGAPEASVEALFEDEALVARARELGLASDAATELLVRRSIAREGRGRVHVNGGLATVALLGELFGDRLEVVSQGEHQRLLRPEVQAEMLDRYGGLEPLAGEVGQLWQQLRALRETLRERRANAAEAARREDQLRFEIEQIERVAPRPAEIGELEAERSRLAHVERLALDTSSAIEAVDAEEGLRDRLGAVRGRLEGAARLDPALDPATEALGRAQLEIDDALATLQHYATELEADPARLERVESRLHDLQRLQARYGPTVEAILDYLARAREELDDLGGGEVRIAELEAEASKRSEALAEASRRLGKERRRVAAELEGEVTREVRALDLRGARFEVRFEAVPGLDSAPSGPRGAERASFQLVANTGEDARGLRDAASGGELARLLLALRNSLREADRGSVLLFDEVDAGIGGRTARRVGERLRALGRRHQILCITHQPQIAAFGSGHFRLWKRVLKGRTVTRAECLEGDARVDEIARMAGGGVATPAAREHARELLGSPSLRDSENVN